MAEEENKVKEVEYVEPKRAVLMIQDMAKWEKSETYHEYVGFVMKMNDVIKSQPNSAKCPVSQVNENLLVMLDKLDKWIDEIPPIDQPQRFGNKAFRNWLERVREKCSELLSEVLPETYHAAIKEISPYLLDSFGNHTRIDYGTGHEMAFAMFLCSLFKIQALKEEDSAAVILKVFTRYLKLMRKLQIVYRMEPAGSHGVWSLDDYQFLPFIWGSSQLINHKRIEPKSFPNEDIAEAYSNDFMFMSCIKFVFEVKTGPFAEHSNQLWNISGVPTWDKVNTGLLRMYKVEVLGKFPVIQHVLFGKLFSIEPLKK